VALGIRKPDMSGILALFQWSDVDEKDLKKLKYGGNSAAPVKYKHLCKCLNSSLRCLLIHLGNSPGSCGKLEFLEAIVIWSRATTGEQDYLSTKKIEVPAASSNPTCEWQLGLFAQNKD
jgi:hypothetical protein